MLIGYFLVGTFAVTSVSPIAVPAKAAQVIRESALDDGEVEAISPLTILFTLLGPNLFLVVHREEFEVRHAAARAFPAVVRDNESFAPVAENFGAVENDLPLLCRPRSALGLKELTGVSAATVAVLRNAARSATALVFKLGMFF